jgi:hypothetical protein
MNDRELAPALRPRVLMLASSTDLEAAAAEIASADPDNRALLVVNNYTQTDCGAGDFVKVDLLDFEELLREGDPELTRHLYKDRPSAYRRSHAGTAGSTPAAGFANSLRVYGRIRHAIQEKLRVLSHDLQGRTALHCVRLEHDTAGFGNGSSIVIAAALKEAAANLGIPVYTIQVVVESTIPDKDHPGRVDRAQAHKLVVSTVTESERPVLIAGTLLMGPPADELYYLDQPAHAVEVSKEKMVAYVREMVETMLEARTRKAIDGKQQQWADQHAGKHGQGAPVAGIAGHVVARFDLEVIVDCAVGYQLPALLAEITKGA